jgi:hypothetical protein
MKRKENSSKPQKILFDCKMESKKAADKFYPKI